MVLMKDISVVVDSVADLPQKIVDDYGLELINFPVVFGERNFLDKFDLSPKHFFHLMRNQHEFPKTAAPPAGSYLEVFRRLVKLGKSVLSFTVTSRHSAAYQSALLARSMIPEGEVEVIDSGSVSMGLGFVAMEAAEESRKKSPKEKILERVKEVVQRVQILALIPDVRYAERTGRISQAVSKIATLLNIKPIIRIRHGIIDFVSKASNYRMAMDKIINKVRSVMADKKGRLAVMHADALEEALELKEKITKEFFLEGEAIISEVGPALGSHSGPGALAVAFYPLP